MKDDDKKIITDIAENADDVTTPTNSADVLRAEAASDESPVCVSEAENTADIKPKRKPRGKLYNAIKVFGFILLVLAINAAMYFGGRPDIPGPTHSYRTYQLNRIFGERRNSIDVLYVGHSGVHCGVSPMEMYDKYGIAGYSLSQPLMLPWESYETVVDVLREQSPKIIALEVNAFFYDMAGDYFNSYAKRFTLSVFPFYESHLYWRDGFGRSKRDPYKNFPFYSKAKPSKGKVDRHKPPENIKAYKMHKKHMKYLKKFVELCRSRKDTELVLFELPVVTYWSWERHECVKEFAEKNGLKFFDMNVNEIDRVNIDWKQDFLDAGDHLNYYGAVKASDMLGAWLRENFDENQLPSRKGTPEYKDWDADLVEYRKKAATMPVREVTGETINVA